MAKFADLDAESRVQFYKDAKDMCGPALAKQITETIQWAHVRRQSTLFSQEGEFQDEEDVKAEYQSRPDVLDNILANAKRMHCPVRCVDMLWVPKFLIKMSQEDVTTEQKKRQCESETTVRPNKKPAIKKEKAVPALQAPEGEPGPIHKAQKLRLIKIIPTLEETQRSFSTLVAESKAEDVRQYFPPKLIEKAEVTLKGLEAKIEKCKEVLGTNDVAKGGMKVIFVEVKELTGGSKNLQKQMRDCLDLAAEDK